MPYDNTRNAITPELTTTTMSFWRGFLDSAFANAEGGINILCSSIGNFDSKRSVVGTANAICAPRVADDGRIIGYGREMRRIPAERNDRIHYGY